MYSFMRLIDWFKGLFNKKEVTAEEIKQTIDNNSVRNVHKVDVESEKKEIPETLADQNLDTALETSELLDILNIASVDKASLGLDKISSEAETISNYCKGLIKDLGNYQDLKDEKDKIEPVIKAIGGKIKVINNHSLELKNLLANLEDHYYNILIEALAKVNEKVKKDGIDMIINDLKKDLELVKKLDAQLTNVIGYNDLFNIDKNPEYKSEIEKEAMKRVIHGDLNRLLDGLLNIVVDRSLGIKAKIDRSNPIDATKSLI